MPVGIAEALEALATVGTVAFRVERRGASSEMPARENVVPFAGMYDGAPGQAIATIGRRARCDVFDSTWRLRRLVRRGRQVAGRCMNHESPVAGRKTRA